MTIQPHRRCLWHIAVFSASLLCYDNAYGMVVALPSKRRREVQRVKGQDTEIREAIQAAAQTLEHLKKEIS
ncbi:MAG: hypothetical protein RSI33_11585 [Clostridia bacterium]